MTTRAAAFALPFSPNYRFRAAKEITLQGVHHAPGAEIDRALLAPGQTGDRRLRQLYEARLIAPILDAPDPTVVAGAVSPARDIPAAPAGRVVSAARPSPEEIASLPARGARGRPRKPAAKAKVAPRARKTSASAKLTPEQRKAIGQRLAAARVKAAAQRARG